MDLSFFVNRNYLLAFLVAIYSLSRETKLVDVRVTLGFYDDDLAQDEAFTIALCNQFGVDLKLASIPSESMSNSADVSGHFGAAAYGKIFLAERMPEPHLYSDVDVFFKGNNQQLLKLAGPAEGRLGAVSADSALVKANRKAEGSSEFFSGLLYWPPMTTAKSHEEVSLRCGDPAAWNFRTGHSSHDQAVLNTLFGRYWFPLSPKFCQLDYPDRRADSFEDGIIHYFGNWKPWHVDSDSVANCIESRCGWSFWFEALSELRLVAKQIGVDTWLSELESAARTGASAKLQFVQRIKGIASSIGAANLVSLVVRALSPGELHGFHKPL